MQLFQHSGASTLYSLSRVSTSTADIKMDSRILITDEGQVEEPITFDWLHQPPPVYRINLSLPPSERYTELARLYRDRMRSVRSIFDELLIALSPKIPVKVVHWIARVFLHGLSTREETEELQGISRATDIDIYLLVCFNTGLDLLMGCTSGGVRTINGSETKMLHFRTLDWGMEKLRSLVVQLEFVRNENPQQVLATSVTYVGFVGVLTGVRKDLSLSLNFRPTHESSNKFSFYLNHILVLLGKRPSVSSLLRQCLFSFEPKSRRSGSRLTLHSLDDIVINMPKQPSTAAYLIFSDGQRTVTMEKDVNSAFTRSDTQFIVITNNDQDSDSTPLEDRVDNKLKSNERLALISQEEFTLQDLIEDSKARRACMQDRWDAKTKESRRTQSKSLSEERSEEDHIPRPGVRSSLRLRQRAAKRQKQANLEMNALSGDIAISEVAITPQEALQWLTTYPVVNEDTHYAALMDPAEGKIIWVSQYYPDQITL